jgi:hypothetical protein
MPTWFLPEGTGVERRGQHAGRSLHSNRRLTGSVGAPTTAIGSNEFWCRPMATSEIRTSTDPGSRRPGRDARPLDRLRCPRRQMKRKSGNRLTLPQPEEVFPNGSLSIQCALRRPGSIPTSQSAHLAPNRAKCACSTPHHPTPCQVADTINGPASSAPRPGCHD